MQRTLIYKILIIFVLALFLMIPLSMIRGTVHERQALHYNVVQGLAQTSTGSQIVAGPIFNVPYKKKIRNVSIDAKGKKTVTEHYETGTLEFLPDTLTIRGKLATQQRSRGIFKALIYDAELGMGGYFDIPANFGITENVSDYQWGPAFLTIGISDIRGIKMLAVNFADETRKFKPGTNTPLLSAGVHAELGQIDVAAARRLNYSVSAALQGMQSIDFAPLGKHTRVEVASSWPHPSFTGRYLPEHRQIGDKGFNAVWQTSHFATNMQQLVANCATADCPALRDNTLGVNLIEPVNIYLKAERSLKYGFLFIALTFIAFFLFEVLKELRIHPIQYSLVGVALALFYLLLISLSEHLEFALSYAIAALACVALLGFYVRYILASKARAFSFSALLGVLYGLLYVLLQSEDYSLLVGALLLFVLLGLVMTLTRKIDWYRLGTESK